MITIVINMPNWHGSDPLFVNKNFMLTINNPMRGALKLRTQKVKLSPANEM